jgi:hypothetical protein
MMIRYLCSSSPAAQSCSITRRGAILATTAASALQMQRFWKRRIISAATTAPTAYSNYYYYSTSRVILDDDSSGGEYKTPPSVLEWEKGAAKELSKSKKLNVDYLRTQRLTAEGIAMQPVYYDLKNSENPDMPGVYPYTRGPYAVRL